MRYTKARARKSSPSFPIAALAYKLQKNKRLVPMPCDPNCDYPTMLMIINSLQLGPVGWHKVPFGVPNRWRDPRLYQKTLAATSWIVPNWAITKYSHSCIASRHHVLWNGFAEINTLPAGIIETGGMRKGRLCYWPATFAGTWRRIHPSSTSLTGGSESPTAIQRGIGSPPKTAAKI